MKIAPSLQTRLVLSHLLVALVSITVLSAIAGRSIFTAAREEVAHNLEDMAFALSNALELPIVEVQAGRAENSLVSSSISSLLASRPNLDYAIYWPDGSLLLDRSGTAEQLITPDTAPEIWNAIRSEIGQGDISRINEQGEEIFYVATRIQKEGEVVAILRLSTSMTPAMDEARRSLGLLMLTALLVAIAVSLFGWILANNLSRPIKQLTRTAETLANGNLDARVTPSGPPELNRLAEAFNSMAFRLQDHVDELRAFVANASHELRTPLTVVKLRAEALRNGAMEDPAVAEQFLSEIESEVDRLSYMVNDMLDLSRMEAGLASKQRSSLNLGTLTSEVAEVFSIRAARAGIQLVQDIEIDLPAVLGNEDQLRRLLYNLVENAIKYTPRDGHVDLQVQSSQDRKSVMLQVRDSGPGIAPEHLQHIFERFYRAEATRPRYTSSSGSGLGLAIAKTIVDNHGGKIGVSSRIGEGTAFSVRFPAQNYINSSIAPR
jgi:two-component system, OmpR family, sensor kinase